MDGWSHEKTLDLFYLFGWDSVVAIFWPFFPLLHISMFHTFLLIFRVCLQVLRLVI
jgi:hypothetical protein